MGSVKFIIRGFIQQHSITIIATLVLALVLSNLIIYASMKAEMMSIYWKYDQYKMHVDSVFEMYNVNKSYSRVIDFNSDK
jgi:hypothetical protein